MMPPLSAESHRDGGDRPAPPGKEFRMTDTLRAAAPAVRRPASLLRALTRGVLLGLAVCVAVTLLNIFAAVNLHVVVPGLIYRSSQVSEEGLDKIALRLGIRTVIN